MGYSFQNRKVRTTFIFLFFLLIVGVGCNLNKSENNTTMPPQNPPQAEKDKVIIEEAQVQVNTDEVTIIDTTGTIEMKSEVSKGTYEDYTETKLALAQTGDVVLFFHAPWCPTCKVANTNFSSTSLPDGLTILKVDYDSSSELKKKYGVTYQHTFVQVNDQGEMITKWSGSNTVAEILKKVE